MFLPAMYIPQYNLPKTIQGKVAELRQELNAGSKKDKNNISKKIALKKIVANMTMSNNDMVALFPDVVNCMDINSLEIKKMYVNVDSKTRAYSDKRHRCFLFLVNYARIKPDVALKALPTLELVCESARAVSLMYLLTCILGLARYEPSCPSISVTNHVIHSRPRIC